MDRPISYIYIYIQMALKPVIKRGFLCMGVVLRGSVMIFKMSWYGYGFKEGA